MSKSIKIIDLGKHPLADSFLKKNQIALVSHGPAVWGAATFES